MTDSTIPDELSELVERAMSDLPTWQPEMPDELLAGEVVKVDTVTFNDGDTKLLVTLRRASTDPKLNGVEMSPGTGTVLQRNYRELALQPGDLCVFRYLGEKQGRSPKPYKNYRVEAVRDGKPVQRTTARSDDAELVEGIFNQGEPPPDPEGA